MMTDEFASHTDPIPPLRHDLELLPVQEDGEDLLLLRDPSGYSEEMLLLRPAAMALLRFFDGQHSVQVLQEGIRNGTGVTVDGAQILDIVQSLDRYHFLANDRFHQKQEHMDTDYISRDERPAAHAGRSYPEDPEQLADFLHELFDADGGTPLEGDLLGVLCPHIDLQIGPQVYVPAFRQLAASDVDTVVILGTSHYSYEDLFILTRKDFVTPLGRMRTDHEFVEMLHEESGDVFTRRDVAHRQEHSIEFPMIFLQHIFGNNRVRVVPVLCTSFDEYLVEGTRAAADAKYEAFITAFHRTAERLGRKVAFVLSVDWSHVGRKFGDDVDAAELLEGLRVSDLEQLGALERCDYERFYELLRESHNASKIDGFACITTFFDIARPQRATLFDYQQWHEEERASAVTFASMAFFADGADAGDDGRRMAEGKNGNAANERNDVNETREAE